MLCVYDFRLERQNASSVLFFLHVGIVLRAEFDSKGRPGKIEFFAEERLEVAAIRFADIFECIAVHNDDGRVAAALVCVAGLGSSAAGC